MSVPFAHIEPGHQFAVLCFGFEKGRIRRQPWHVAHGLASGLRSAGHDVTLFTDGAQPPADVDYTIERVPGLFERGRAHDALAERIETLQPDQVFVVIGARQLVSMRRLPWRIETHLIMASPRARLTEFAALGIADLWRERHLLALPLIHALLPGFLLARGFRRSGARDIIYLSEATRSRYQAVGLPRGRRLLPQVASFPPAAPRIGDRAVIAFMGPPLALRGAYLALDAFAKAVAAGLDGELRLLLRPDVSSSQMQRFLSAVHASPARMRITIDTSMLGEEQLRDACADVDAFLLPCRLPVSDVPIVVIEAALSGRPVVVLDAPGVTEFASELGGIVANRPETLAQALIHSLQPRPRRLIESGDWTDWQQAADRLISIAQPPAPAYRMLCLCGVDGSGKTTLAEHMMSALSYRQVPHRHVWSRFRNYTSKPLLALARLTGHNRKEQHGPVRVGYHDFAGRPWLAVPFLALQVVDNIIDILVRYHVGGHLPGRQGIIVGDRCVLDTIVDLCVDTGYDDFIIGQIGPRLLRLLPRPHLLVVIRRAPAQIAKARPDALLDRNFARRRALYERVAQTYGLPILLNDGPVDQVLNRLDRLLTAAPLPNAVTEADACRRVPRATAPVRS